MSDPHAKAGATGGAEALGTLYREAATAEPPPALDRTILAAAHAELAARQQRASPAVPWWRRWLPATTALAALVLGLSLTLRVMDEQERRFREEGAGAAAPTAPSAAPSTVPQAATDAAPAANTAKAKVDAARRSSPVPAEPAVSVPTSPVPAAPVAAPSQPAASGALAGSAEPAPADARKKELRMDTAESAARPEAAAHAESALRDAAPRAVGGLEKAAPTQARPESALGAARPAAKAVAPVEAAGPEAWLARIRELKAAGRLAEAAQSLARLRERHPGVAIPADLADLERH